MINVKIEGLEKLEKWTLKLPKTFAKELNVMFDIFNDLYQQRLDDQQDIHGAPFEPNRLIVGRNRLGTVTLRHLKSLGGKALVRSGKMRDSLVKQVGKHKAAISFSQASYGFPYSDTTPAQVAAKQQQGFTVSDGEITRISGYANQPAPLSDTGRGLVSGMYFLRRGFSVPSRQHFGIPGKDVALFSTVLHASVREALIKNHGGTH